MNLDSKIEAILFYRSEPTTVGWLSKTLNVKESDVWDALAALEEKLRERGIRLIRKDDSVLLGTAPEASALLEEITKEELHKDLGKAALETLTIVLYQGPVTKSKIDYIRGVNSGFILRNLLVRGLVERIPNPDDQRGFLYRPTIDVLSHLGITKQEDLPEYGEVKEEVKRFEEEFNADAERTQI